MGGINVGFVGDIERGMWGFIGNVYNTVRKIHPKKTTSGFGDVINGSYGDW